MSRTSSTFKAEFVQRLQAIVGEHHVLLDTEQKAPFETDWLKKWSGVSCAVVQPRSTQEVSQIMTLCHETRTPVVTQGGNTGMSGGATPDDSGAQVILSLTRMNTIREVDVLNNTLTAEAGVLLANIQQAAEGVNRYFPLSLGSEGSCTIGGNLATNAGGISVLRYGNTRDLALGLEVVLPDGKVWRGLRGLRKDNSGYDLKDLFIGSEGTLGVITSAVLKLFPKPTSRASAWVGARDLDALVALLGHMRELSGDRLVAFEMLTEASLQLIVQHVVDVKPPLADRHRFHALIELADTRSEGLHELIESGLSEAMERDLIQDAVIGLSLAQRQSFWKIREGISQAQVRAGYAIKHDVALPISVIPAFVAQAEASIQAASPGANIINFGHLGDGNLHFNVLMAPDTPRQVQYERIAQMNRIVHDLVIEMGGTLSAEHGIGQLRRDELKHYKPTVEFDLMMLIKQSIDPNQIMNPGKLL